MERYKILLGKWNISYFKWILLSFHMWFRMNGKGLPRLKVRDVALQAPKGGTRFSIFHVLIALFQHCFNHWTSSRMMLQVTNFINSNKLSDSMIYINWAILAWNETDRALLYTAWRGLLCHPSIWFPEQQKKILYRNKISRKMSQLKYILSAIRKRGQKSSKVNVNYLNICKFYSIFSLVIQSLIKFTGLCQHPVWDSNCIEQSEAW